MSMKFLKGHSQRISKPRGEGGLENQDKLDIGQSGNLDVRVLKKIKNKFLFASFKLSFPL
jgi:hypothetical protein